MYIHVYIYTYDRLSFERAWYCRHWGLADFACGALREVSRLALQPPAGPLGEIEPSAAMLNGLFKGSSFRV